MKKQSRTFLADIDIAAGRIARYIKGLDRAAFLRREMVGDAVVRNLEIIGEAARNVPDEVREKYPHIPWKQLVGLRNILIHAYFGIDYDNIWKIISEELPTIHRSVQAVIADSEAEDPKSGTTTG